MKLDNHATAYAKLWTGAETPILDGFPLPSGRFVISATVQEELTAFTPGVTQNTRPARGEYALADLVRFFSSRRFLYLREQAGSAANQKPLKALKKPILERA